MLQNNGKASREITGTFGKASYRRTVLYPADPESAEKLKTISAAGSVYPLDEVLGLAALPSQETARMMCCIAREAVRAKSYSAAAERIGQKYHTPVSSAHVQFIMEYVGACVLEAQRRLAAEAEQNAGEKPDGRRRRRRTEDVLYFVVGSGPVALRDLPGKEAWGVCQGAIAFRGANVRTHQNPQGEIVRRVFQRDCVGSVDDPEAFYPHFLALARRQDWDRCSETIILSDGASWVRDVAARYLPDCRIIVDLSALRETVGRFAEARIGGAEGETFAAEICGLAESGHLEEALQRLEPLCRRRLPKGVPNAYAFLEENRAAMDYPLYKARGYLTDSSALEGASVQQLLQRLNLHGSRWIAERAQQMLTLQARYCSGDWGSVCRLVHEKVYGTGAGQRPASRSLST